MYPWPNLCLAAWFIPPNPPWKGGDWREAIANFGLKLSVYPWPNLCLAAWFIP
ncbi:hypothetical protein [Okeania sp. SIO3I5]|uniref:hypothetical protein n=1 Tax=Okeania sp. SIO3I5 TaxID=2607805 RepID=UPI0025FE3156|nr:hypothetical protein [Okeania sp. SIO3I5]